MSGKTIRESSSQLSQPLGFPSAITLVIASMIGVGVYTTSGFTLAALGSPGRVVAAWMVGALIAICGSIGFATLASRFTESGGEYLFLARSLHPAAGLMAGWVSMLAGFTGAIAIAAHGFEQYSLPLLSSLPGPWNSLSMLPEGALAIATVLVTATLHSIGVRGASRVQEIVVLLKLLMIVGFIGLAVATIGSWPGLSASAALPRRPLDPLTFVQQLVWISFSFAGFNAAVYVAGEVENPEHNVPRALVLGTVVVSFIYIALNAIFVYAPTSVAIIDDERISQVASTAAGVIGGTKFALFVRSVIIVSLLTSASAMVMTGPRVYAKMADDGFLPNWFRFEGRPPVRAIWFQAILAVVVISISSLKTLLGYLGLTLSICSALTVAMLFVLRRREGSQYKLPLAGVPQAFYVLASLSLAVLYAIDQPKQLIATVATLLIGLVIYPRISTTAAAKR